MISIRLTKIISRLLFIITVVIVFFSMLSSYMSYQQSKISNHFMREFQTKLYDTIEKSKYFDMKDVTHFEWDLMYVFDPYISQDYMVEKIGREWNTNESYLNYLIDRSFIGQYEHPLTDDSVNKLVFVSEHKIVLDVTIERDKADFLHVPDKIKRDNAKFTVNEHVVYHSANGER